MYGKLRVVLSPKPLARTGTKLVTVAGGGGWHPMGRWYERDGLFYADLRSTADWYVWVRNDALVEGAASGKTKAALREAVKAYCEANAPR
jgi:hypothetical protein